jgi:hypothetical protein
LRRPAAASDRTDPSDSDASDHVARERSARQPRARSQTLTSGAGACRDQAGRRPKRRTLVAARLRRALGARARASIDQGTKTPERSVSWDRSAIPAACRRRSTRAPCVPFPALYFLQLAEPVFAILRLKDVFFGGRARRGFVPDPLKPRAAQPLAPVGQGINGGGRRHDRCVGHNGLFGVGGTLVAGESVERSSQSSHYVRRLASYFDSWRLISQPGPRWR